MLSNDYIYMSGNEDFAYFRDKKYLLQVEPQLDILENMYIVGNELVNEYNGNDFQTISETVLYIGHFSVSHFGNTLIDNLSRLWYVPTKSTRLVFTASNNWVEAAYFYKLLSLLGYDKDKVQRINNNTKLKRVIVPQKSFIHDKYVLPIYLTIFERMNSNMQFEKMAEYDKIYLTRKQLKRKKEVGERKIEEFFISNGYQPIALETLSLEKQAYILSHCREVASIEGTHAHSIVWSRGNIKRQIIIRKQSECIPRQMMLNEIYKIPIVFVDAYSEPYKGFPINHDRGPFLLCWNKQLEKFAMDNKMIIPKSCLNGNYRDYFLYTIKCIFYKIKHIVKHLIR